MEPQLGPVFRAALAVQRLRPVLALGLALWLASWLPLAGANDLLQPGEYIRSGDSGWLRVQRKEGRRVFELESTGPNCHSCGVSGRVEGDVLVAEEDGQAKGDAVCRVRTMRSDSGIRLAVEPAAHDACRQHCGMRAGMEGTYRKPPRLCTRAGQQAARDRFTAHYRARRHAQAAATLQPLLDQCGEFMDGIAADRLRNDLALAQLRSSGPAQCLQTLEETRAGLLADEAALRDSLPPCDFDNYLATARATWHNIRVCTAARDRAR